MADIVGFDHLTSSAWRSTVDAEPDRHKETTPAYQFIERDWGWFMVNTRTNTREYVGSNEWRRRQLDNN
jgi:hypothetical protein